jgi:hypothetical protein
MQKFSLVILVITLLMPLVSSAQQNTCIGCKGTVLFYQIEDANGPREVLIEVTENKPGLISFDWMSLDFPASNGSFSMGSGTMREATSIMLDYYTKPKYTSDSESAIWFPIDVMTRLRSGEISSVDFGNGDVALKLVEEFGGQMIVNARAGKYQELESLPAIYLEDVESGFSLMVLDDPQNPIILKTEGDYSMELIGIF